MNSSDKGDFISLRFVSVYNLNKAGIDSLFHDFNLSALATPHAELVYFSSPKSGNQPLEWLCRSFSASLYFNRLQIHL